MFIFALICELSITSFLSLQHLSHTATTIAQLHNSIIAYTVIYQKGQWCLSLQPFEDLKTHNLPSLHCRAYVSRTSSLALLNLSRLSILRTDSCLCESGHESWMWRRIAPARSLPGPAAFLSLLARGGLSAPARCGADKDRIGDKNSLSPLEVALNSKLPQRRLTRRVGRTSFCPRRGSGEHMVENVHYTRPSSCSFPPCLVKTTSPSPDNQEDPLKITHSVIGQVGPIIQPKLVPNQYLK